MHRFTVQALIALIPSLAIAAAPAVGIVTAVGSFTIDNSPVSGNATLFEGNRIETGKDSSRLRLNSGVQVQLAAGSRGIVYGDRLVLEKGSSRFEKSGGYRVEALTLRIRPEGENTAVRVSVRHPGVVQVAALTGAVRVTAASGVLLANLQAGGKVDLTPNEPGATAPTTVTGCLVRSSGKFELTDEVSQVRFEVLGAGVEKEVGHRVRIAGTLTPGPESLGQVYTTSVTQLSKKCSSRNKAVAGAGPASAAIATRAVIAGVIVAGAATVATVAIVRSNGDDSNPSISQSGR